MPRSAQSYPGFFFLVPEVYGQMGPATKFDHRKQPPVVERLEYVFDSFPADPMFTTSPCYLAFASLVKAFEQSKLSGFSTAPVTVKKADQYHLISGRKRLPETKMLVITGIAGRDDFGLLYDCKLVLSSAALAIAKQHGLSRCRCYDATIPPTRDAITRDVWKDAQKFADEVKEKRKNGRRASWLGDLLKQ